MALRSDSYTEDRCRGENVVGPKNVGKKHIFWNAGICLPHYMVPHPRRQLSSQSSVLEPQISQDKKMIKYSKMARICGNV
jgi:hypothetical protein